jgi:hypothetical protein
MAKSPFSSAGGGSADSSPYSEARANGGRTCTKADGGAAVKAEARKGGNLGQIDGATSKRARGGKVTKAAIEKAEASPSPKLRSAAMKAERAKGYDK